MARRKRGVTQFLTPQAAQAQLDAERPRQGRPSLADQGYSPEHIQERQREQSRRSSWRYYAQLRYDASAENLARDLNRQNWQGTRDLVSAMHSRLMDGAENFQRNAYEASSRHGRNHVGLAEPNRNRSTIAPTYGEQKNSHSGSEPTLRSDGSHSCGQNPASTSYYSENCEEESRLPRFVSARVHDPGLDVSLDDRTPAARDLRHSESYNGGRRAPSLASEWDYDSVNFEDVSPGPRGQWLETGEFDHFRSYDGRNIKVCPDHSESRRQGKQPPFFVSSEKTGNVVFWKPLSYSDTVREKFPEHVWSAKRKQQDEDDLDNDRETKRQPID